MSRVPTVRELALLIGKEGSIEYRGLTIFVRVTDVTVTYGKPRYEVSPVEGLGHIWVEDITINDE